MILFVTIPMLYIIYISFMSRGVFGDVVYKFSTESYKTILNPTYFKVILKSLKAAGITTILCLLLGYPLAYIIAHKPKDTAAKLITLIMIPFWTNSLMRLNSWLLLFQTSGPINNFLVGTGIVKEPITFIYTDGLVLIGLITNMLPFAVLPLYSTIEKLDKSLIEASADLGASAATTFMRVTLQSHFRVFFQRSSSYLSRAWVFTPLLICWAAARSYTLVILSRTSSVPSETGRWVQHCL